MHKTIRYSLALTIAVLVLSRAASADVVMTFADIEFWAGSPTAANRAAFVVDWRDGLEPLAWGFRWDGAATGEDMLRAMVQADSQLYAKLGAGTAFGVPMYGIGHDRDADGFAISDGSVFPASGLLEPSAVPDEFGPGSTSNDPDDSYGEAWNTGFWAYWQNVGEPYNGGSWESAMLGMSDNVLSNNDWNGWSLNSLETFEPPLQPLARPGLATAIPEPTSCGLLLCAAGLLCWRRVLRMQTVTRPCDWI